MQVDGVHDRRKKKIDASVSENCMPRITPIAPKFEKHITVAMNTALGVKENPALKGNPEVNAQVDIMLNLTLVCGLGGEWTLSQAQIINNNYKPISHASNLAINKKALTGGPVQHKQMVWRPKTPVVPPPNPRSSSGNSDTKDPNLESSSYVVPSPALTQTNANISATNTISSVTPETHTWEMLLREGRRIFTLAIPPMPPIPISANPFHALSETCLETVMGEQSGEAWDDEASESSSLLELTDKVVGGKSGELGCWDDKALWVEPLAISFPAVEESTVQSAQAGAKGVTEAIPMAIKEPQSNWVMEQMKEFGLVLGASFDGFEDKILELLVKIEASSSVGSKGGGSQARKSDKFGVSRESRNLISGVNYVEGSSRRTASTSGKALLLSP